MRARRKLLTAWFLCACPIWLAQSGCVTKNLAFTTATKFALDISQKADQTIDVSLGYDRAELACIPAPETDAKANEDTYSVLGTFYVDYGNPWTNEAVHLNQFFATGWAASKAASNDRFQKFFASKAAAIKNKAQESNNGTH